MRQHLSYRRLSALCTCDHDFVEAGVADDVSGLHSALHSSGCIVKLNLISYVQE